MEHWQLHNLTASSGKHFPQRARSLAAGWASFYFMSLAVAAPNGEVVIQVSESGLRDGKLCSSVGSNDCVVVNSLNAAQALIDHFNTANRTSAGIPLKVLRIILPQGVYRTVDPINISKWGLGLNAPSLVIAGAGAKLSRVVGSVQLPVSAWRSLNETVPVSDGAMSNVRIVSYDKITGRRAASTVQAELFGHDLAPVPIAVIMNDSVMTPAHWPAARYTTVKDVIGTPGSGLHVRFADDGMPTIPASGEILAGYLANDWAFERIPVTGDPKDPSAVIVPAASGILGLRVGQRVMLEGSLSDLDSPNEWSFDAATQELYFWPPSRRDNQAPDLQVALATTLMRIADSKNVRIEGLDLENSLGDAIDIENSSNIALNGITFRNIANKAVSVIGGGDVDITNCLVEKIGAGGIYIYGGDRKTLTPGLHRVQGCEIREYAQRVKTYQPAIMLEGVGNAAVENYIHNSPHTAIMFSGNDQLVESNNIRDVVQETDDAGAIYTGRDWTARGTIVRNNFVHNVQGKDPGKSQAVGLYLDDQASGVTADGNIFADVSVGILLGGGRDNEIIKNVFFHDRVSVALDARGMTWQKAQTLDERGDLRRNLKQVPFDGPLYGRKYPHLVTLLNDVPGAPKYNEIRWNLMIDTGPILARDHGYFSWSDSENEHFPPDVLASGVDAKLFAFPRGYEIIKERLPSDWPRDFLSRDRIPTN